MILNPFRYAGVTLLLDDFPAEEAYSLRKLRTAYAGSANRIRRVSDNAESDVGFSVVDYDISGAETFLAGSSGRKVTWYSQGSVGTNIANATTTQQPEIASSGTVHLSNGKAAVKGLSGTYLFATKSFTQPMTTFSEFAPSLIE